MPEQSSSITFNGVPVVQADPFSYPAAANKANGYKCPIGPDPGIGYVLIKRSEWDKISAQRHTSFALSFRCVPRVVTLPGMRIVSAINVTAGDKDSPDAVYMLKLTDKRWHARMSDIAQQFNMRCPAPPATSGDDLYYEDSLNSGVAYTWAEVCSTIWALIPGFGSFPGLPVTPDGTPEDFSFVGVSAIDALMVVLKKIGCTIAYNPITDGVSIIECGITQAGLSAALATQGSHLIDMNPFNVPTTLVPHTIRVYFHRLDEQYGCQKVTQRTTGAWATSAWHSIDVASGMANAVAGSVVALWDDLPALYDPGDSLTNGSALSARATARATDWINDATTGAARRRTMYQGPVEILPGSQISTVYWRALDGSPDGDGLITEVMNGPGTPKLPDAATGLESAASPGAAGEALAPPDLNRHSRPHFPPLVHLVRIGGDNSGDLVGPTGDNLWSGQVLRVDPTVGFSDGSPYITGEDIWISVPNLLTGSDNANCELPQGERFFARLSGSASVDDEVRPHYSICRPDNDIQVVTISAPVSSGGSATVTLQDGRSVSATNIGEALTSGTALAFLSHVTSQWFMLSSKASSGGGSGTVEMAQFIIGDALSDGSAAATDEDAASITVYDHKNLFQRAMPSGGGRAAAEGVAIKDENDEYVVVECQSIAGWIYSTIDSDDFATMSSSTAAISIFGGTQQDVQQPGTSSDIDVYDEANLYKNAISGAKNFSVYDNEEDVYRVVISNQKCILGYGTLAADMESDDIADVAVTLDTNLSAFPFSQIPGDITEAFNAWGSKGKSGDPVLLIWSDDDEKYYIMRPGGGGPKMYKAKLNGALGASDSSATIDTVTAFDGATPPSPTTASNWLAKAGPDNADCWIMEDSSGEGDPFYRLMDVKMVPLTIQLDTTDDTTQLTKNQRAAAVYTKDTSDTETKISDITSCT